MCNITIILLKFPQEFLQVLEQIWREPCSALWLVVNCSQKLKTGQQSSVQLRHQQGIFSANQDSL